MNLFLNWLHTNYIEVFGAIAGLIYLFLSIRQNIWLWPLGFVTSALYIYVFFKTKFYADMGLQVYYMAISVYGWYNWLHGDKTRNKKDNEGDKLPVTSTTTRMKFGLFALTSLLFVFIAFILVNYTDSELPYWDSFTTSASITATWMLARKYIGHWIVWIIVDATSVGLYIYKGLYPTVVLFIVYTSMAFWGYREWKKELT